MGTSWRQGFRPNPGSGHGPLQVHRWKLRREVHARHWTSQDMVNCGVDATEVYRKNKAVAYLLGALQLSLPNEPVL